MNSCTVFQVLIQLISAHATTPANHVELAKVAEYQKAECVKLEEKEDNDRFEAEVKKRAEAAKEAAKSDAEKAKKKAEEKKADDYKVESEK